LLVLDSDTNAYIEGPVAVDKWIQLLLSLTRGGVVSSPGVSPREFNHDFDSVCHKERVAKQAAKQPDGAKYWVFAPVTHPHDGHLA
jgi:hypothetical protein